jgi:uncharacterized membrane protein YkoI
MKKSIKLLGATAVLAAIIPLSAFAATADTTKNTPVVSTAPQGVTAPESATEKPEGTPEVSDPNEQAKLQQAATITKEQAIAFALKQVSGTVKGAELEDENGVVVYGVQIVDANGKGFDVKVDAKTGKVTKADQDDNGGNDGEVNDGSEG